MAVYNEVQVGRYVRFLQKFLGIKGRQPAPLAYSGELGTVWPLFHGCENRYLEGWNQFGFATALAASAANQNAFQFRNPATSGIVAVFTKLKIGTTNATGITYITSLGPATTDLAGGVLAMTGARFDPRGNPTPNTVFSFVQTPAPGDLANSIDRSNIGAAAGFNSELDIIVTDIQEIPLLPGDALRFRVSNLNVESEGVFWWRERVMEESERT